VNAQTQTATAPVEQRVGQLIDNLRRTADAYTTMLDAERRKQESVVACDAARLLQTIEDQKPACSEVAALERSRLTLLAQLGRSLGIQSEGHPTIRQVADATGGDSAAALAQWRARLIGILDELGKVHQSNTFLITRSLEVLDHVLAAVFDHLREGTTYHSSGQRRREGAGGALLSQAY